MTRADCLFCKIVAGEIPSATVYENERVQAFLDIAPVNPGHALVVPKAHFENLFDAPDDTLAALIAVAKTVARAVKEATGAEGINIGINNGAVAGQVVPHLHIHIMPRRAGDGYALWRGAPYPEGEMDATAARIRAALDTLAGGA